MRARTVTSVTVELDQPDTWPSDTRAWIADAAADCRGSTELAPDLPNWLLEREEEFRASLGDDALLAYHCTRLLHHEREAILAERLRPLDGELVQRRIAAAVDHGVLDETAHRWVRDGNVYAINNTFGREGQVCFVVGRSALDLEADGLSPFLTYWGGEALRGGPGDAAPLRSIGLPAIVVCRLQLAPAPGRIVSHPPLSKLFVGASLGLEMCAGALHVYRRIAAANVVAVWQPGDPDYDRHAALPRD
jgi:hypothetical protein